MAKHIDFGAREKKDDVLNMGPYIKAELEGKIDNCKDFKSEALTPLFEAIVNSIQAIKERQYSDKGEITINIIREPHTQETLSDQNKKGDEPRKPPKIKNFEIMDNGIGFNDPNFNSFEVSDSIYKKSRGGKGVGRFSWLKAFDKIEIDSVYSENGNKKKRFFGVTAKTWISPQDGNVASVPDTTPQQTIVRLVGFKKEYRKAPTAYKTTEKIAQRILEHFLPYYIQESAPSIKVKDGGMTIDLDKLYRIIGSDNEEITVGEEQFTIHHVKLYDTHRDAHKIVFCANDRDVKIYKNIIKQIIGTTSLQDGNNLFYYAAYVSGNFFDAHVDSGRTSFDILEDIDDHEWYGDNIISLNKIKDAVIERSKNYLSKYIEEIKTKKINILSDFSSRNPQTRHVLAYCPNVLDEIDVDSPPEKINEVLHKNKGRAEYEIQKNVQELINKTQPKSFEEIQDRHNELTQKIDDFNTDDLAGYLIWRKLIIQLLENKIKLNSKGQYEKEAIIHDIVFPRKTTSDQIAFKDLNLWIIDEQLSFHQFAASDKELQQISSSDTDLRPDVFICTESDENQNARSISIIEFKRPQRKHFDEDPVSYMYKIVREIKDKKIQTQGRPILTDLSTRFYCYAICDITKEIEIYAENHTWVKLKDNLGYYQFNPSLNSYTEILSFDEILNDVKRRHKIFFEKLGIQQPI